jgi:hypothetical protein
MNEFQVQGLTQTPSPFQLGGACVSGLAVMTGNNLKIGHFGFGELRYLQLEL